MGKKVHNAKARVNPKAVEIDNSDVKNVQIEFDSSSIGTGFDEANALVLPSKKRKTTIKLERKQHVKILSKKQRKHLQNVVDKKKKKEERVNVLEALAKVQIPLNELKQYTSISQVQTVGLKKLQTLEEILAKKQKKLVEDSKSSGSHGLSSIKGAAKRKLLEEEEEELEKKKKNPNFLGIEDDDDDESDEYNENEFPDEGNDISEKEEKNKEDIEMKNSKESKMDSKDLKKEDLAKKTFDEKDIKSSSNPLRTLKSKIPSCPAVFVGVDRDPEIQAARLKLPILAEEQLIMETINENSIVIIAGETGSGKTTQIPQFLYEAGYAENNKIIGITEPRRVAAIAMSKRVAFEMKLSSREVSYLIRFEGNVTPDTRIKFMTDGVLLKEIESDFLLNNYSVIILDEAHERSSYTDILVGLLSRIVPLRLKKGSPLKLIIMSATLRVEDFTSNKILFKIPPPLLKVEARQFPVTIHFQKRTPSNYLEEAYKKTLKIHAQLPEGGILIFLTGQQEVNHLVRKLRRTFPFKPESKKITNSNKSHPETNDSEKSKGKPEDEINEKHLDSDDEFDMRKAIKNVKKSKKKFLSQIALPKINLDDYKLPGDDTEADLIDIGNDSEYDHLSDNDSLNDDKDDEDTIALASSTKQPLWVLPLYSLLSTEKQNRIFDPPPEGCRLCVVSTNIAETSLTIPNIKYVVDSGKQKTRFYDKITGVNAFIITNTSKASADQRAGRAGRISAGHCYRLYSSAVFDNDFEDFSIPDIQMKPVDDLMLQMRCMGIDRVINFPFPSPPDIKQLQAAEQRLILLGALEPVKTIASAAKLLPPILTKLGQVISRFPVAPRFGKMLALSHQQNLLPYTVCLAAALSVQEILMEVQANHSEENSSLVQKWQKKRLTWASTGNYQLLGDPMVLLRAVGAAEYAGSKGKLTQFCSENGLRLKAITEVRKLRKQLTNEINLNVANVDICVDPTMSPPTDAQARFLRQILLAGMGDRVAHKIPLEDISDKDERRRLKYAYNCSDLKDPVYIHSSSVLKTKLPDWLIYQEVYEVQNGTTSKTFIRGITVIEPEWLLLYVPLMCNIKNVREDPPPKYNPTDGKVYCYVDATFGQAAFDLPLTEIEMPLDEKACCYFGMFILEGLVCPKLKEFKTKLKSTPSSITKSWSNLNESIMRYKKALINKQINSRKKLYEQWESQPTYLLEEYHNLLYDVTYTELSTIWPPVEK